VEIHATLAGNLLDGRRIRLLPAWLETTLLLLLPLAASLVFMQLRPLMGGVVFLLGAALDPSWRGCWLVS
jgi:hypothetical protein